MSANESTKVLKGHGIKLVGNPEKLLSLLIKNPKEEKWAFKELTREGPKHKQVLSALLLLRVYKLLQTVEKSSGTPFNLQEGFEVVIDGTEKILPVLFPINITSKENKKKIVKAVSHAPEHEMLAYSMALQVIEWAIKTIPETAKI